MKKREQTSSSLEDTLQEFMLPERLARLEQVLDQRSNHLTVVLDRVQNYHNISAVIRSADAFGICAVHLIGEEFAYSSGISLGTERWMSLVKHPDAKSAVQALQQDGYTLVATAPADYLESTVTDTGLQARRPLPIFQLPFQEKLALVFGNERSGISKELFEAAKYLTFIPMFGFVESLNVSVACAISLFASTLAVESGERQVPLLNAEERETLKKKWLRQGMRRSEAILREVSRRELQKGE